VGKRRHCIVILGVLLLFLGWSVYSAEPEITFEIKPYGEDDEYQEVYVDTPLANFVLSEQFGSLKSVFLTFAPYGSNFAELVYGAQPYPEDYSRSYREGAEFPFTLMRFEAGESNPFEIDGAYTMGTPALDEHGVFHVAFTGEFAGYRVEKTYTIDPNALYTLDFEIELVPISEEAGEVHLLFSKIIPSLVERDPIYIFNGAPSTGIYARGSYGSFGGLGQRDGEVVNFLIPVSHAKLVPFAKQIEFVDPPGRDEEKCFGNCGRYGVLLENADEEDTYRFTMYSGRRRFITLEAAGLEDLDQTGFFARLMVYVIKFLNWLYLKTGNYGWAIILFTILMRLLLFPLMRKQYHSMARIQQIQPKLKKIQERYKDNREEMQKRTLEIYRKEKVNPMSGCFPMAIQLPIIIIIWRALLYASELIHLSPGFLWLPDLSLHDPYFILVILTTLIMIAQQYFMSPMTTPDAKGPQKYMGYFFPVLMAVLLWKFPAGLWLYYLLTTAAQVGQQAFVNWEMARAGGGSVSVDDDEFDVLPPEDSSGDAAQGG